MYKFYDPIRDKVFIYEVNTPDPELFRYILIDNNFVLADDIFSS